MSTSTRAIFAAAQVSALVVVVVVVVVFATAAAALPSAASPTTTRAAAGINATYWTLPASAVDDYAAKAFVFALQGLANRGGVPALFVNTSVLDFDFPGSDDAWRSYLAESLGVVWQAVPVVDPNATTTTTGPVGGASGGGGEPGLCDLAAHFRSVAPTGMAM